MIAAIHDPSKEVSATFFHGVSVRPRKKAEPGMGRPVSLALTPQQFDILEQNQDKHQKQKARKTKL